MISVTHGHWGPEVHDPHSDVLSEGHGSLMLPHSASIVNLTSSHHVDILSSECHHKKGECNTVRYERDIHIDFIPVYYYNCSTLLLVIVNLLPYLI